MVEAIYNGAPIITTSQIAGNIPQVEQFLVEDDPRHLQTVALYQDNDICLVCGRNPEVYHGTLQHGWGMGVARLCDVMSNAKNFSDETEKFTFEDTAEVFHRSECATENA
ncbi:MAG: hypothetical protein ACLVIR_01330 [Clostridium sp.]